MNAADLMCPGLLNEQTHMDEVDVGAIVSVYVFGHEHCIVIIG